MGAFRFPPAVLASHIAILGMTGSGTPYKKSSRDTYIQKLSARQLVIARRGEVTATPNLFTN